MKHENKHPFSAQGDSRHPKAHTSEEIAADRIAYRRDARERGALQWKLESLLQQSDEEKRQDRSKPRQL